MNDTNVKKALSAFELPSYQEIPDVGLYLEQVAKYLNSYFTAFPEMQVTTSMISNYAKQKLIRRASRKTYDRNQIALLMVIVLAKNALSIENIKRCIETWQDEETVKENYTFFTASVLQELRYIHSEQPVESPSSLTDENQVLRHIAAACARKMYLEKYFELLTE